MPVSKNVEEVLPLPPKARPKTTAPVSLESPLRPRPAVPKAPKPLPIETKETLTPAARTANDNNTTTDDDQRLYCAFFPLKGGCQKGDRCVFSHCIPEAHLRDPSRIISLPTRCNSQVKGGECKNGPYCPYIHYKMLEHESLSATTTMSGWSSAESSPEQSLRHAMIDAPESNNSDVGVMDDLDEFPILGAGSTLGGKQKPAAAKRASLGAAQEEPVAAKRTSSDGPAKEEMVPTREAPVIYAPEPPRSFGVPTREAPVIYAPEPPRSFGVPTREAQVIYAPKPQRSFGAAAAADMRARHVPERQLNDMMANSNPALRTFVPPPMWGPLVQAVPLPAPQNDIEEALDDDDIHLALGCLDDLIAEPAPPAPAVLADSPPSSAVEHAPQLAEAEDVSKESEPESSAVPEDEFETVTMLVDTDPMAEGYLLAFRGETVMILHTEDEWYYGVISGDGDRIGWFAKKDAA